jgi:cytochrome c oxidase subunit 3
MEATYEGHHTKAVQGNILFGMKLFILSEVMFFASFFWAFFHSTLGFSIYSINSGEVCPQYVPLANTIILMCSGYAATWAHENIARGNSDETQ